MVFVRKDGLIGFPEVSKADTLLERIGHRFPEFPELTTSGDTSATDHASYYLPRMLAQCQPNPAFTGSLTYK